MMTRLGKDLLIVDEGPMTRERAKQVKEVIGLLVQATMDDLMFYTKKETSFKLRSMPKNTWINVLEPREDGGQSEEPCGPWFFKPCGHMA